MQHLEKRLYQHKYDQTKRNDKTALATHAKEHNHKFQFSNTKIIAQEENMKKRKIREVIEIFKNNNNINLKSDTVHFEPIYAHIFKVHHTPNTSAIDVHANT